MLLALLLLLPSLAAGLEMPLTEENTNRLYCQAGISMNEYKLTAIYVRCPPDERFCVKIRFEDSDPDHAYVKYVTSCAHRQTCSRVGCALTQAPSINSISVATCCCNTTRCNQYLDVDSLQPSECSSEVEASLLRRPREPRFIDEPAIETILLLPSKSAGSMPQDYAQVILALSLLFPTTLAL